MAPRDGSKTITKQAQPAEPAQELFTQRKRPVDDRYRLQVDRQTKRAYATSEAAQEAGLALKQEHPIVQVVIYDALEAVSTVIELPKA